MDDPLLSSAFHGALGADDAAVTTPDDYAMHPYPPFRQLENDTSTDDDADAGLDFEDMSGIPMLEVIAGCLKVYGSVFAVFFFLFLLGRAYYPKAYLILKDSEEDATELSKNTFGKVSWMWKVFGVTDDEIYETCGMDAVVFIRTLRFGMRVAGVAVLNGIYLFPVYATSGGTNTQIESVTLGNVPQSSPALLSATVACYIVYSFALYLLYREFGWYTEHRHKFLSQKDRVDNYTAFVKFIPSHLRSDAALLDYFRSVFGYDEVVDARITLEIPSLDKAVADRDALTGTDDAVGSLEHAINVLDVKGIRPRHKKLILPDVAAVTSVADFSSFGVPTKKEKKKKKRGCCATGCRPPTETVDSIDEYTTELDLLNQKVGKLMDDIDAKTGGAGETFRGDLEAAMSKSKGLNGDGDEAPGGGSTDDEETNAVVVNEWTGSVFTDRPESAMDNEETSVVVVNESDKISSSSFFSSTTKKKKKKASSLSTDITKPASLSTTGSNLLEAAPMGASVGALGGAAIGGIGSAAKLVSGSGLKLVSGSGHLASGALSLLGPREDGTPRDAGFVSFSSLKAKASAVQMIHHPKPFTMQVQEAPPPEHLFWANVGMTHKTQQIGRVVAAALTITLCLFWTVIISFITSLGNVDSLTKIFPFLEDWIIAAPWLEMFLAQLKPLLLYITVTMLPAVLIAFSKREGHIGEMTLQTSMFFKLSVFLIIQLYFVVLISGTITEQIQAIIDDPMSLVQLLAEAIPQQAGSFVQYAIVQTALNLGFELLRLIDICKAWARGCLGPKLTDTERGKPWFGLDPLSVVPEMDFADVQANLILYYLILFTYSVMSPFTSIVLGICFFLFSMGFRHQLLYLYGKGNDSGGELFGDFVSLAVACLIISEIVMFGVLGLKGGVVAAPLLIPLIIGTFMFKAYINQQHYLVTKHLPSTIAVEEDRKNMGQIDLDFFKGAYRQPAFEHRFVEPENMSSVREERPQDNEGSQVFMTPDNSEAEIVVEPTSTKSFFGR